jgi:uncharacterized protein
MTYLDTSVLAAYYCPEALSDKAEDAIIKSATPLISQLVELELQSAVARKIREKALVKGDGVEILTRFRLHLDSGCYSRLPIESSHYDIAAAWISALNPNLCHKKQEESRHRFSCLSAKRAEGRCRRSASA